MKQFQLSELDFHVCKDTENYPSEDEDNITCVTTLNQPDAITDFFDEVSGKSLKAPIFAIDRLRMGTDGPGITTLVCFMGCPLKCAYCLNNRCHDSIYLSDGKTLRPGIEMLTPQELYERVKVDNLYFQATGGGVCFGGGEPTLYSDFIVAFRKLCGNRWTITVETSLACSDQDIVKMAEVVDYWFVDIKDMHDVVYEAYTGKVSRIRQALCLLQQVVATGNIKVRVPLIPAYNTEQQVEESVRELNRLGFDSIQTFRYRKRNTKN